jgi:hypothetical protein
MQHKQKAVSAVGQEALARRLKSPGHQPFNLAPSKINRTGKKKGGDRTVYPKRGDYAVQAVAQ